MKRPAGLMMWLLMAVIAFAGGSARAGDQWLVFEGKEGPGKGKHIVLISGDEEYRSEEALPQLAKILAKRHGFKTTVVFAIDKESGQINPDVTDNIPGIEALKTADLMIIATRFRNLPDEQMQHVVDYINAGKPIIGLRTATHAFNIPGDRKFAKYGWDYGGEEYKEGFGRQILGETWVNHHGDHGSQSTRGLVAEGAKDHPITRGIKDGDIWGPTDVYGIRDLPENATPIVMGQVLAGMEPQSPPVEGGKNEPMMPVGWVRTYKGEGGEEGRVFATTMGAATDLVAEGTRRMIVNGVYWCLGMEKQIPADGTNVEIVGDFQPTNFGFGGYVKGKTPKDYVSGAEDLLVKQE